MTIYLHSKRPVHQARGYNGYGEGTIQSIVSWLSGMYPEGWVEGTESYDPQTDQMVAILKVGDTGPVDENTQGMTLTMNDYVVFQQGGVLKASYEQLIRQYDFI